MCRENQQLLSRKAILGDFVRSLNKDLKSALEEIKTINLALSSAYLDKQLDIFEENKGEH